MCLCFFDFLNPLFTFDHVKENEENGKKYYNYLQFES